jgi:hypothetical protein
MNKVMNVVQSLRPDTVACPHPLKPSICGEMKEYEVPSHPRAHKFFFVCLSGVM